MTAFVHGKVRAHVMDWNASRKRWVSICSSYRTEIDPQDPKYDNGVEWPMRYDPTERLVPWCKHCVSTAQRVVDELTVNVLEPAAREAS